MPLATVEELRGALDLDRQVAPDQLLAAVVSAADRTTLPYLTPGEDHGQHDNCRAAGLAVAVQIWSARVSPGGRITGQDLAPIVTPYLLGPGLVNRVRGLVGGCWNVKGLVG